MTATAHEPTAAAGVEPRNWRDAVDESLRTLGLIGMVLMFTLSLWPIALQHEFVHRALPGFVGLWLLMLACTAALWLRTHSRRLVHVLLVALVVVCALMVPARHLLHPGDLWAPGMWAVPVLVLGLQSLSAADRRRWFLPTVLALGVVELAGALFFYPVTASRLLDSVMAAEIIVTLYLFGDGLLGMAARHDEFTATLRAASASHLQQQAEADARREAARILHDHVLHALHAIAEDRSLVSVGHAANECRDTVAHVAHPQPPARQTSLEQTMAEDPVLHRLGVTLRGSSGPLPSPVAAALAAATREALVNVERHAPGAHCQVRLESFGSQGCRVSVVDDGPGFDPSRRSSQRLGLRSSVHERLHDIGGLATVTSAPGRGTTVQLVWPVAEATPGRQFAGYSDAETRRMLVRCALPGLVSTVVMMALVAPELPHPGPAVALTLASLALGAWHARRVPEHGMTNRQMVLLLGLALAAWVANLRSIPSGWTNVYFLWMAWGGTAVTQLAMLTRPNHVTRWLGAALMTVLTVGVVAEFSLYDAWQYQSGAILAGGVIVVVGYSAVFTAQRIAAQTEAQDAQMGSTRLAVARLHEMARLEQFWSDRVTGGALPLIRGVAEGRIDPADPATRQLARSTESLVRDELVLGPGHQALGDQLARLRADGWVVASSLSREDGAQVLERAARLAGALGPAAEAGQRVTLAAAPGCVTAVVLGARPAQLERWTTLLDELGGTMDDDPDFARMALVAP